MHNKQLERNILYQVSNYGGLVGENIEKIKRSIVSDIPTDFFYELTSKKIHALMIDIYNENKIPSLPLILDKAEPTDRNEITEFLNVDAFASIHDLELLEKEYNRQRVTNNIDTFKANDSANVDDLFFGISNTIAENTLAITTASDVINNIVDDINNGVIIEGLKTGLNAIDDVYYSIMPTDFIVIAARPGIGKTTIAMNISENLTKQNKRVVFVSLEMGNDQLGVRLIAKRIHLSMKKIAERRVEPSLVEGIGKECDYLNYDKLMFYTGSKGFKKILSELHKLITKFKIDLIVIDYLQLLSLDHKRLSRNDEIGQITRSLKLFSLSNQVPIIALSQLSRPPRDAKHRRPNLTDLRDSGNIEQDADGVFFLYVDNDDELDKDISQVQVYTAKNRNGKIEERALWFDKKQSLFSD